MKSVILYIFFWIGGNFKFLITALAMALVGWLILYFPLRNKKKLLTTICIFIAFLSYSWDLFRIASGLMYDQTSNKIFSLSYGGLVALIVLSTPIVLVGCIKTIRMKWLYAVCIIFVLGSQGVITSSLIKGPLHEFSNKETNKNSSLELTAAMTDGASQGNIGKVKGAVARGADVNQSFFGLTALYSAAGKGHIEIVKYLLANNANINQTNGPAQRTALHEAALRGHYDVVKLLLENGANVNARNSHKRTPLFYVISPPLPLKSPNNKEAIAELLTQFGGTT